MKEKDALKPWQALPLGGVITEGGNAARYETGTWRTKKPIWIEKHCVHCLQCWVFCPEESIQLTDGLTASGKARKEVCGIDYFHCKGCGLCARECPVNKKKKNVAIDFVQEQT